MEYYAFTPNQYLTAYGLDPLQAQGYTGQGERVGLLETGGFDQADLDGFRACFGLAAGWQPVVHTYPEGTPPLPGPGGETILDLSILAAAAPGLAAVDVFEATSKDTETVGETMSAMIHQPKAQRPTIISISLGVCEARQSKDLNKVWERANRRAAALGISVFVSSGDEGPTTCRLPAPWGTNARPIYSASYPSTSPWVTAVGGTNLELKPSNEILLEIPWNNWTYLGNQGGYSFFDIAAGTSGTSHWFKQPGWQRRVIGKQASPALKAGRVTPGG